MSNTYSCHKNSRNYSQFYNLCDNSSFTAHTSNTKFLPPSNFTFDQNFQKTLMIKPENQTTSLTDLTENYQKETNSVNVNYENNKPDQDHKTQENNKTDQDHKFSKKIWGPSAWDFLNSSAWGYPENPTKEQQTIAKLFWETLPYQLPCSACEGHCINYIRDNPPQTKSRHSLTKWLWNFHNAVNYRLGKPQYPWADFSNQYSPKGKEGSFPKSEEAC